jgi:hypothetical protein
MAVSSIAHNADIDATRLISTAPARRKEANIMNMRVKEAYSRDGSECQYQYVGEAGKELCTILPNPSRIKNDDAKLIDKIGFIIVTTLDKFRHKRAYDNSHITGLMMDEIAALLQPFSCCQENKEKQAVSQTSDWETKRLADAVQACFDHNRANPEQAARTYEALEKALAKLETNE